MRYPSDKLKQFKTGITLRSRFLQDVLSGTHQILPPALLLAGVISTANATTPTIVIKPVNDRFSNVMLAEFLLSRHQEATASKLYQQLAFNTLSPNILERALSIALEQHDNETALHIAQYWVEHEPHDIPALFYLAHLALKNHDYPLASQTLDKILNYDPNAALDRVLAGIYPEKEEDRQALLQALMQLDSHNNPSLLVLMAGLQAQNGQLDEALKRTERALKKRPDVTAFMTLKANILIAQNKLQEAERWLNKQTQKQPHNKSLQLFEVRYLLKQHEESRALRKLDLMCQRWPNDGEILLLAGLVSIDQKQYLKADAYLLQLLTQDDYLDQAYYYLAINAQRQNRFTVAASYFQKVEGDLYQSAQKKLALMLVAQNQFGQAISYLTQERVNHPDQASFLYQLQVQLLKDGQQPEAARKLLDEALISNPDDPELIYARILLLGNNEQKLLDRELERLLSIEPNSPTYLNAYAYTLATQNRRLNDARRLAERANSLAPDQSAILDTLGFVALQQKDYKFAINTLEHAYQLSDSASIAQRLLQAYQAVGNQAAAQQIQQQLQSKNSSEDTKKILP